MYEYSGTLYHTNQQMAKWLKVSWASCCTKYNNAEVDTLESPKNTSKCCWTKKANLSEDVRGVVDDVGLAGELLEEDQADSYEEPGKTEGF